MPTLHGLEPEQLARIGIFYLEQAVLDVFFRARKDNWSLQPVDISEALRIPATQIKGASYSTVHGILDKLASKGLVRQENEQAKAAWELTQKGYEYLRDKYDSKK